MMATTKLIKVQKVKVGPRGLGDGTVALGCEFEGARYHVWINPETMDPGEEVFKNPLVDRAHPDYFNTRKLRTSSQWCESLIASMIRAYHEKGLLAKFEAEQAREKAEEKVKRDAARRLARIRSNAPKLLEELNAAAHECANATAEDLERLKDLAQGWAKLVAKCESE